MTQNQFRRAAESRPYESLFCRTLSSLVEFLDQSLEEAGRHVAGPVPIDPADGPLVLFGVAEINYKLWRILEHSGLGIYCLCDNNPNLQHGRINGLEVLSPAELTEIEGVQVVTAMRWEVEIAAQMRSLGLDRVFFREDLKVYEQRWVMQTASFIKNHLEELATVLQLLEDERSRFVMLNILKGRVLMGDPHFALFSMIMEGNQYWALPQFQDMPDAVYVDAGPSAGDTIESFIFNNSARFERIWAFEPGPRWFERLQGELARMSAYYGFDRQRVTCVPKGLAGKSGLTENWPVYYDDPGRLIVDFQYETISLDENDFPEPVNIIKADIEGLEMEMLLGGENLIRRQKPKLAICIYHRPEDFFAIPLYLKKLVPEYKMAVRHHAKTSSETVLYCWVED